MSTLTYLKRTTVSDPGHADFVGDAGLAMAASSAAAAGQRGGKPNAKDPRALRRLTIKAMVDGNWRYISITNPCNVHLFSRFIWRILITNISILGR